ncbi:4530_t:CDS:2 [Ambispora gerdemannii]|uniref:4530_t:CDS:1 n=1 Tax=Ambispora gerdemannii TaxID=144530 RepID=A0A9N8YXZ4_9GLOM|nr:4530_t:CDS:2 [Ambispora gerdemannii]
MAPPNTEDSELIYRSTAGGESIKQDNEPDGKFERHYVPPNLTIKEIRQAIPPHCFQRSTQRSLGYLLKDLSIIGLLVYGATFIDPLLPNILRLIAWTTYWFFVGAYGTGVWVLAHECGHRSFSPSRTVNNIVGWILHSALLVPFHSWRITHSQHHKNTANVYKDQVFVPKTRSELGLPPRKDDDDDEGHIFQDAPIYTLLNLIAQQLFGWPLYLIKNASSRSYPNSETKWINHYNPSAPMYTPSQYMDIVISDIGIIMAISTLTYLSFTFSLLTIVKFYFIPYLIVNHWLVMITFLQHTDPKVPFYRDEQWDFVRGAASTVDRHFGFLDDIFHKITSTHVAHHYFSEMPFYHAEEATKHLAKVLGKYYLFDDTPKFKALWRSYSTCKFIEDEGEIIFLKY